jgi:nitrous oxidase accessory protein NosD
VRIVILQMLGVEFKKSQLNVLLGAIAESNSIEHVEFIRNRSQLVYENCNFEFDEMIRRSGNLKRIRFVNVQFEDKGIAEILSAVEVNCSLEDDEISYLSVSVLSTMALRINAQI